MTSQDRTATTGKPPLVTTIIPTFNRVADVATAVRSALAQTYTPHEVIVIDDGSTDGTRELLAREFGDRIRYHAQPNAGVSAARNHGARCASGELLAFLDSDDEWLPHKLERQVGHLIRRPDCEMVLCDVEMVTRAHAPRVLERRRAQLPTDGSVLRWVVRNPALVTSSAVIQRRAFEALDGFDVTLRTAEDLDFHLRFARTYGVALVEEPLVRCVRGMGGLSMLDCAHRDYLAVVERFVADPATPIDDDDRSAAMFNAYLQAAKGFLWDGDLARSLLLVACAVGCVTERQHLTAIAGFGHLFVRNLASRALRRVRTDVR